MNGIVDRIDALPLKKELDKLEEKCKVSQCILFNLVKKVKFRRVMVKFEISRL